MSTVRAQLEQLIGADNLLPAGDEADKYLIDHRRLYRGRALAIARPRDTAMVAALLAWCNQNGVGVVPQGGNTSYCGGATPDESGSQLLLSLERMNRIRSVDAGNNAMTVEAGCVLARIQQTAQEVDRFFPLSLGSEGSCQIGGNLATNAGGLNVLRFGMTRDLVLGIEAVLPDGRVLEDLKCLHKDNTGYDLRGLFVGSEGTLGVITAATLKLWPRQRQSATAFVGVSDPTQALALLTWLRQELGEDICSFELMPRSAIDLVVQQVRGISDPSAGPAPWYVLCEISSSRNEPLTDALISALSGFDSGSLTDRCAIAMDDRQRNAFWQLRENIPEAQRRAGPSIKHDVSVPVAALPTFIAQGSAWVATHVPEGELIGYGHAGDGNLHFNIGLLTATDPKPFLARAPQIHAAIHDMVVALGGSISAEHGIGQLKRSEFLRLSTPNAVASMRAIKAALDPRGIMNPGKLL